MMAVPSIYQDLVSFTFFIFLTNEFIYFENFKKYTEETFQKGHFNVKQNK